MVLFPVKNGEHRVCKTWTPADLAREEKAAAKHKTPWQERGPSIPSTVGGEWRGQRWRPRQGQEETRGRWGNKGGKKHQKKKLRELRSLLQNMPLPDADEETEPSASASSSATSSSACSKASSAPRSASPSAALSVACSEEPLKPKGHLLYHRARQIPTDASLLDCFVGERKHQTCTSMYKWTVQ